MSNQVFIHWYGPGFDDAAHPPQANVDDVVIFVHGWAVKWDSKGLFIDLARTLASKGVVSALFDLSDYDESGNSTFLPLTDQQDRIRQVESQTRVFYPSARMSVIAHSMGCRVMVALAPEMKRRLTHFILLAPAVGTASPRLRERMLNHPGSYEAPDGSVIYNRKDGTRSYVSHRYLEEFNKNWDTMYPNNLKPEAQYIVLAATDERQPTQQAMLESLGAYTLKDSDHNFTGKSRSALSKYIADIF